MIRLSADWYRIKLRFSENHTGFRLEHVQMRDGFFARSGKTVRWTVFTEQRAGRPWKVTEMAQKAPADVHGVGKFPLTHEMSVTLVVFDRKTFQLSAVLVEGINEYIDEHVVKKLRETVMIYSRSMPPCSDMCSPSWVNEICRLTNDHFLFDSGYNGAIRRKRRS